MVQAQILNLIEKLRKEFNMGFILITHDLSILAETCDKIAVMYAGKIVEIARSKDIFEHTSHPYTDKLIKCFPDINRGKVMPEGIPGAPPNMLDLPTGCPFSVSYTHLGGKVPAYSFMLYKSVSYTHLDVYKRQEL